jgi:predicted alpha/beta-fold hydrolase
MAAALHRRGFDVLAWNFLGAGDHINRGVGWYHSGSSDQLRAVVRRALTIEQYHSISLVGFSLGGNVTLKYLGEEGVYVNPRLAGAVVFSVPCDLASCAAALAAPRNRIYMANFLSLLGKKLRAKAARHPGAIDLTGYRAICTFAEYDERYTAPLHGFRSAQEYWRLSSSRPFIGAIRLPTTIISARDDPFLTPACFPFSETVNHSCVTLEAPPRGGHVGFVDAWRSGDIWSERRTAELLALGTLEKPAPSTITAR